MRAAWLTDIHLNFLSSREVAGFGDSVRTSEADAILVGGDTGEAESVGCYLREMALTVRRPIYFVLGNHDYYRGSIAGVRTLVRRLAAEEPGLVWLPDAGVVRLGERTALVGHDGWADGRYGAYWKNPLALNDYLLIRDLTGVSDTARLRKMQELADQARDHFLRTLPAALAECPDVILLTHVPPFPEACLHQGRISGEEWLPHFASKASGEVLLEIMRARPDRRLTVLCGHTHGGASVQVLPNLLVLAGEAEYGAPRVQQVLVLP